MGTAAELDLESLASLLVLVEEGGFARASVRLHLTSSALTKRIQRLEHQMGAQLVERGPSGMLALTAAGCRMLPQAKAALELARSAQRKARNDAAIPVSETVRIGVPGILDSDPALATFIRLIGAARHWVPGVEIRCVGVPYGQVMETLLDHRVDIMWTPSRLEHHAIDCRKLAVVPRIGVVPDWHPLAQRPSVDVEQFSGQPILYHPGVPEELMAPCWLADVRPRSKARLVPSEAPGMATLKKAVSGGHGLAVLPAIPGLDIGRGFRALKLDGAAPSDIHAVYPRNGRRDLIHQVVELLEAVILTNRIPDASPKIGTARKHTPER